MLNKKKRVCSFFSTKLKSEFNNNKNKKYINIHFISINWEFVFF
jgi:hypothetical protein